MAHYLPPAIMAFFQARPALEYKAPPNLHKKKNTPYTGVAAFVPRFADPPKPVVKQETPAERKAKHAAKVKRQSDERLKRQSARYDPDALSKVEGVTGDAMKTLFVGRLAYDVTEEVLRTEFDYYGPVKHVKLVKDKAGKSRGYAFVEFESSRHLKEAYKDADGRKINGRRILVDVERGRTVKGWKPRRLGGGLGGTRLGGKDVNQKYSGREPEGGAAAAAAGAGAGRDDRDRRDDRSDYRRDDRDRGSDRGYDRRDDRRDDRYRDRRDDRGSGYDRGYDRGGYDRGGYDRRGGGGGYGGAAAAAAAAPRARSRSRSPPHSSGAARARSRERSRSRDRDGRRR